MSFGKRMIGMIGLSIALYLAMFMPTHGVEIDSPSEPESEPEKTESAREGHWRRYEERDRRMRHDDRDRRGMRHGPHHPRLSPEERLQLRRDIREAGREIYPARHRWETHPDNLSEKNQ